MGSFLSGGIHSGTIVALMGRLSSEPVRTFCIGFGGNVGGYLDERKYARQVASRYRAIHKEYEVHPDLPDIVEDITRSFDEPFGDHSTIPSYYVCKTTRQNVKVALPGLGGDELFGGYERYLSFKLSSLYNRFPQFIRENVIREIVEAIPERNDGHYSVNHMKRFVRSASLPPDSRYFGYLSMLNDNRTGTLFSEPENFREPFHTCKDLILSYFNSYNANAGSNDLKNHNNLNALNRVFYCDMKTYLPEDILACTDRMSMRHSLEVRVPFLDHKLMEFCATIPHEMKIRLWDKKHILKKATSSLLPKEVVTHRKQDFVGPMARWLQGDLKGYVLNVLSEKNMNKHCIFNNKRVKNILDEHFNRMEINDKLIWSLVMLQSWFNLYIEDHSFIDS